MLIDLVKKNRSYRGYDPSRKVTREELLTMVEAARLCPSGANMQPLKFFLAWEPERVAAIQAETRWAKAMPEILLPHPGMEPPAFIVICQDTDIDPNLSKYQKDVGVTAQTMLLTAAEMGLGGCMLGNFNAGAVHEAIGVPANIRPLLVVAVGRPAEEVILTEVKDGKTGYYRDEKDRHYVPKRALEDIVLS